MHLIGYEVDLWRFQSASRIELSHSYSERILKKAINFRCSCQKLERQMMSAMYLLILCPKLKSVIRIQYQLELSSTASSKPQTEILDSDNYSIPKCMQAEVDGSKNYLGYIYETAYS